MTPPRTILHADLDTFFVSVERILDPSLRGKAVIVGGKPGGRGVVAACSYETRTFGVRSGMPLRTAGRLCPDAVYLPVRGDLYREYSARVTKLLRDAAPVVEKASVDEFYLDITGCEPVFGDPVAWAESLRMLINRDLHLPITIGVAENKLVAKIATGEAKRAGRSNTVVWIRPGTERGFLAPLPVSRIPGIGPKTHTLLKHAGLERLSDVQNASEEHLRTVIGDYAPKLRAKAFGEDEHPVQPHHVAKSIGHERTLGEDTSDFRVVLSTLRYLAEKTAFDLRRKDRHATRVVLKLRYADFETHTRTRRVPATSDDNVLFDASRAALGPPENHRKPVRLIGIRAEGLVSPSLQADLYDAGPEKRAKLHAAVDELKQRFGFDSVRPASRERRER